MSLVLYNSLTKREEEFHPLKKGEVKMYTCGPTVYSRPHIGNYSSFLMADLLRRWLEVSGYKVMHVKNITDVGHLVHDADRGDDKVEREAKRQQVHPLEIAKRYTDEYLADERALNIEEAHERPRASETIPEMLEIIKTLLKQKRAYALEDAIYFSVETFPDYGKLSGNTLDHLDAGSRIAVHEGKKHPADFALWKKCVGENAEHVLRWSFKTGKVVASTGEDASAGFPGWHVECSAMSRKFLGDAFDVHTGGEDNIFPHHECEIAQSESFTGKPFVGYWLHKRRIEIESGLAGRGTGLNSRGIDRTKMSKSLGNVLTVSDVVDRGYDPLDLRYYLLSVHYRTRLKFTWKGMDDAKKARRKIIEWMDEVAGWQVDDPASATSVAKDDWSASLAQALNADLNTPQALATTFDCMSWSRKQKSWSDSQLAKLRAFIQAVKKSFGCFERVQETSIPPDVQQLFDRRETARKARDFALSDALRKEILVLGFRVEDLSTRSRLVPR